MIVARNLRKTFGDIVAVDDVSFTAEGGAVTGLLGPNGAGKTTALRMLSGLMKPESGGIEVDGISVSADPHAAQRRLGVLPDSHGLYPRLTAREHILYFGRLQGMNGRDLEARADRLIEWLGMSSIASRRVEGFSRGERTKVALARAVVHDPPNVLLDEPTSGLDVMSTRAVREFIRRLRADGRTVLFSSHIMQEVSALCDTIIIVSHGRVVARGSPDDIRLQSGRENLEDAFVLLSGVEQQEPPL
jgi:sodium transport system ATP-binding protein